MIEIDVLFFLMLLELAAGEAKMIWEGLALTALLSFTSGALKTILGIVFGHTNCH